MGWIFFIIPRRNMQIGSRRGKGRNHAEFFKRVAPDVLGNLELNPAFLQFSFQFRQLFINRLRFRPPWPRDDGKDRAVLRNLSRRGQKGGDIDYAVQNLTLRKLPGKLFSGVRDI